MIRRSLWLWIGMLGMLVLLSGALPGAAQEPLPLFATNTPAPTQPVVIQPVISTPSAPINNFVLRAWRENDLADVLYAHVTRITPGATELRSAIALTQYELNRRFPGAPRDPNMRHSLLLAMFNVILGAPASAGLDARPFARPYAESLVDEWVNELGEELRAFERNGLQIDVIPANIDGSGSQDAVLHIYYPGLSDALVYSDYVPVIAGADGTYRIITAPDLPAAPMNPVRALELMGVGDFNSDGIDELAVSLDDGQINRELRVFGWRGGSLINLVQPGQAIRYGEMVNWMAGGTPLEVKQYREESAAWGCLGEQTVTWRWTANFFRPVPDPNGYTHQNTANCLLYEEEPLYAQSIDDALTAIDDILPFVSSENDRAAQRAGIMRAMLQAFTGDTGGALAAALDLESRAAPDSWLAQQAEAFVRAITTPETTILQVCAALANAAPDGACDVDAALTRIFEEQPLRRDASIAEQLKALGITVQEQTTISAVGRVDRQVVRFNMAGDHWWAFAPIDRDVYTAEQIDPLPGHEPLSVPLPVITAPQAMYDALLIDNNPAAIQTLLQELIRNHPQAALSAEVRYIQALSYDLLNDRTRARQAYYDLWQQSPLSVWGQLAAEHLEQR